MAKRRIWLATLVVVIVLAAAAIAITWQSELDPRPESADTSFDEDEVARGYALAQLGNCASCHTAEGGEPYSGGRPMATPFGTIYAVNITPDREAGIGKWTLEAFTRSMREGVNREGAYLYPAFPYTHFTHVTDEDISALYAYLRSVPAVENTAPENDLPFPFNIRTLMAGWNLLFLDKGPLKPVSEQSDEWNEGRYLVEGITHCGACHTPRNTLGAEKSSEALAGAEINGWLAPPLKGDDARSWTEAQMAAYLSSGFSRAHGAAAGPMGETVVNLAKVPRPAIAAIANYVSSLTIDGEFDAEIIDNGAPEDQADTHALWTGACATCHENPNASAGDGVNPSYAVSLSLGGAVHSDRPYNAVRTIVDGIDNYRDMGGPYMPAFGGALSESQIADLANYVRARFSDAAAWSDVAGAVKDALGETNEGDAQ